MIDQNLREKSRYYIEVVSLSDSAEFIMELGWKLHQIGEVAYIVRQGGRHANRAEFNDLAATVLNSLVTMPRSPVTFYKE